MITAMKTILFPTDFSPCAKHAFEYALNLSARVDAQIVLLHVYQVPIVQGPVPGDILAETMEDIEKEAIEHMKAHQQNAERWAKATGTKPVRIQPKAQAGFTVQEIVAQAEVLNPYLVVMGTRGASGLRGVLIGSTASGVIAKSTVPVIVVPEEARFTGLERIIYATDFEEADRRWLQVLRELAKLFGAKVMCVHVSTNDSIKDETNMEDLEKRLGIGATDTDVELDIVGGFDVTDALTRYAQEARADLIAMMAHRRNLIDRLFTKSFTRKMTLHSHVPLMIFPEHP